jgi:hypothetical protein
MIPTVLGERCRFNSQDSFALPRISKVNLIFETELDSIQKRSSLEYITAFRNLVV